MEGSSLCMVHLPCMFKEAHREAGRAAYDAALFPPYTDRTSTQDVRAGLRPKPDSLSTLSVLGHTLFIRARQPVTSINTTGHKCRAKNDKHANHCLPYWGHTVLDYSAVLNTALKQCQHLTCQSVCAYSPPH